MRAARFRISAVRPARCATPSRSPLACILAMAVLGLGCSKKPAGDGAPAAKRSASAASALGAAPSVSGSAASASSSPPKRTNVDTARATTRLAPGSGPLQLDEPADIAPIGPATAHELGVVMIDRQNELILLRRAAEGAAVKKPVAVLERKREDFVAYARGPALVGEFGYWVNQSRLLRRRFERQSELEVLATDARNGTRVAAGELPGVGAIVAYITQPDAQGAQHAKLWTSGGKVLELTAEGAGTSSIALARQTSGFSAVSLDGRSGMTPLHARRIVSAQGGVRLLPDVVAWVGASAQATTEVYAAALNDDVWAFVPIEQDVTHFGLAQIHIGPEPALDADVRFATYANGLNVAPVAVASLCGRLTVAFAEPKDATPNAPQVLQIATLSDGALGAGEVVAEARAFADASLAAVNGGGLLTYTAKSRTWAVSIRCRAGRPG